MRKLIKGLLGVIVALVILLVAAVIILPMVIDPNDYKGEIITLVKEKTGRDLQMNQQLNLSVFPWLGVEAGGVALSNAQGFGEQPFAKIEKLQLRVKLMPLLSKRVEVDTLVLEGLELDLQRNAKGVANWDDLAGQSEPEAPSEPGKVDTETAQVSFQVEGVQLQNARIRWRDQQSGQDLELKDVRLLTGSLSPGVSVPVEAGLQFTSQAPQLVLKVGLNAEVKVNESFDHYLVNNLKLSLDGEGDGLPRDGMQVEAGAQIDINLADGLVQLSGLQVDGPEVSLQGELRVSELNTQPQLQGDLQLGQTNVKRLAALFGTQIITTDENALPRVSADMKLAQAGEAIKIDPFKINLDDTQAHGHVHLLSASGPVLRAKLDVDAIDVDRYLPPASEADSSGPGTEQGKADATVAKGNPFEPLRSLDLEAEANVGKLTVSKLQMQQIQLKVVNKKGVLSVKPMAAKLYGGKFNGSTVLDASGSTPKVHAKHDLTGIEIGPLLKDMTGDDRLLGTGEVRLDIRTVGLSEDEIKRSLSGKASFKFSDGAFKGVNLAELLRSANAALNGGASGQATGEQARTDFTSLSASANITKGVISNQDLSAQSPLLRVSGKGKVNLPANQVDYLLTTELVASLEGQGGKTADQLKGLPIPVRIKGPFNDLSYTPDLEGVLKARLDKELETKRQEIESKATEKLQEKLKGKINLPGLFQ